ncbi:MAG: choice-of-anchor D domain-containing protein [Dehalococcoidia bacterium]
MLDVSPTAIDFGDQAVNTPSSPRTVVATNTGATTVTINSVTTSSPFSVSGFSSPVMLAPNATQNLVVTFTPNVETSFNGSLTITSDATSSPNIVSLTGRGVPASAVAELPRVFIDTSLASTPSNGAIIQVNAGGDFQAALNSASCGDTILLQAGATFTGNFKLPDKGDCTGNWIRVRSDALDSNLPPEGTRIDTATHAAFLPKIHSPNNLAAIKANARANHYRFMFLEVSVAPSVTSSTGGLVRLGDVSQTTVADQPTFIFIDRCWIHGDSGTTKSLRRGVSLDGTFQAVIDSVIEEFHDTGADSQAIALFSG